MRIAYDTPTVDLLPLIAEQLSLWQRDPWAGHIHPGDLGWHSSVGPEQMAKDLRVWTLEGVPIAMGMLDPPTTRLDTAPPPGLPRAIGSVGHPSQRPYRTLILS